ncbi:hypothetical protein [Halobacillus sp. Nhm2S1]|uniref:hypothetical protein n=1 Tax=Halobacillus sp. Nhm2S1 TaxID=2866716 RepID=UPI001C72E51C|nr:hypothetical protein [Halobacillus sp. Nhm2S1]MBX0356356.1 hypothetical protein [Halobacillus sp. Nhm2S1]
MEVWFQRSKLEKIKLEWIYINHKGGWSHRMILVIDIHNEHAAAYCYERKQVRTFLKDNMLGA